MNTNAKRLSIEQIDIYSGTQTRVSTNDDAVEGYAEAMKQGTAFPPIVVFFDGAKHYLADGFHRYLAAKRNEDADIEAEIREGTRSDALIFALGANATNGVYRTRADKRNAVEIALEEWTDRSNAFIADTCKVSIELVRQRRKSLGLDAPDQVLGRDGKSYPSRPTRSAREAKSNDYQGMDELSEGPASSSSGTESSGGGGRSSKKNANYVDHAGGGRAELENEARSMIRRGEMDPRELETLPTALPTDYAIAAIHLLERMDSEDPRYPEALQKLEQWVRERLAGISRSVAT